jgi:hypothetical protein
MSTRTPARPDEPSRRFPARLHVLLARRAPVGLVIRRGPSKQVATIGWDRRRDRFTLGQWMKGRIYERRADLSPDGRHVIYFAMNGHWRAEARGAWTAIARAPYLKALSLFPKGDCWHGGGLFTSDRGYWLNDGYGHATLRDEAGLSRDPVPPVAQGFGAECPNVYYRRLLRDGWSLVELGKSRATKTVDTFERPLLHGWSLRKLAHAEVDAPDGKGCYWDEHVLVAPDGAEHRRPDWEWADLDDRRLVWASHGQLFAATLGKRGVGPERMLFDFRPMEFEALAAPY